MPDGELRRAPQPWESKLARTTAVLGAGISSSGDATAIVPPVIPPGASAGLEPAPVLPPPGDFIAPSTPTLFKQVQGINVLWDGLNTAGDLWPYDTSWVEVHSSTTTGFTPGTATLKGRLARPGIFYIGGLTAGSTYYVKLRGADPAGNYTTASAQATSTPGSATAADIVSINASQVTAGTVTGFYISGGTIAGGYISGGTISGGYITGGTVDAGYLNGGTVDGALLTATSFRTAASGSRIQTGSLFGIVSTLEFHNSTAKGGEVLPSLTGGIAMTAASGKDVDLNGTKIKLNTDTDILGSLDASGNADIGGWLEVGGTANFVGAVSIESSTGGRALRVDSSGNVYSYGVDDNTTANAANVRVGSSAQLLRSTSTVRLKDELAPLDDDLAGVPANKLSGQPASVDPYDVLTLTPTEFRSLSPADDDTRSLGFIAEDVAIKLPWAANWDDEGLPSAVEDRPILAALLWVVKHQHDTIADLRTRIEALEAN